MSLLTLLLVTAAAAAHARPAANVADERPRVIVLDVRGPATETATLRATLQELSARRGLPLRFEALDDGQAAEGAAAPWATLSVEIAGADPKGRSADSRDGARGSTLTLREGAAGRLRLRRVVPASDSRAVTIEALATIAYTALETLAREGDPPPGERAAVVPRERIDRLEQAPGRGARSSTEADPTLDPPKASSPVETVPAPAETIPAPAPAPSDRPVPMDAENDGLAISSRAAAPAIVEGATSSSPVRLSLASFAGYETGNVVTGDRRASAGAWGMGVGVAAAVTRWPLAPALCVALGAWHGIAGDGAGAATDGGVRPVAVPQLQGHGELRLTLVRHGRFSAALGPWLTVTRATWDDGPAGPGPARGPGPTQGGAPNQGFDPNVPSPGAVVSRVTRTELSGGLAARVEAELGGRLSAYVALAGTTPLTDRSIGSDDRAGADRSPTGTAAAPAGTRLTLSAFGGLSVAFTGDRRGF